MARICNVCRPKKTFTSANSKYRKHVRSHTKEFDEFCRYCKQWYIDRKAFNRHLNTQMHKRQVMHRQQAMH